MRPSNFAVLVCGTLGAAWGFVSISSSLQTEHDSNHPLDRGVALAPPSRSATEIAEQQSSAPIDLGRMSSRVGEPFVDEATSISAPDEPSQRTLSRAAANGILPADLKLPTAEAWAHLVRAWDEASEPVLAAETRRGRVGKAVARKRLDQGQFNEVLFDESQRGPDGGFSIGSHTQLRHPDEWVSVRMLYREGGGQRFLFVRIMPGEEPQLDEATLELRLAQNLRRDAISRLLSQIHPKK